VWLGAVARAGPGLTDWPVSEGPPASDRETTHGLGVLLELLDLEHMLVPTDHHVGIPLNRCHEILVVVRITRNDADGAPTLYQLRDALQARQPSLDFPRREPHIPLHARVGEGTTDFVDDPNGQDEPKGFTLQ